MLYECHYISFGLTPKVFNTIDIIFTLGKSVEWLMCSCWNRLTLSRMVRAPRISMDYSIWI